MAMETLQTTPEVGGMGHSVKRKEDPRFIRGAGEYIDDLVLPGMLWLDIVRSPYAHARILSIDASEALRLPGVLAVLTRDDLADSRLFPYYGAAIKDQPIVALDKARLYTELQARLGELQQTQTQLIQADKLKALGTLLSGVAHELNNPLSTILMSAQLLRANGALPDAARERAGAIERECDRASRIIRELLAFARQRPPERRRVDVNEVVRDALQLHGPDLALKRVRAVAELESTLPKISADPYQLQQVLLNLFTNAAHAMSASGRDGVLTVRTAESGKGVRIVVEDNGPGIPPEHLRQVFDPFFTTKPVGEGTGLGLSLCIGIIEAHDGRMTVENVSTSGARFTIQLPIGQHVGAVEVTPSGGGRARPADILFARSSSRSSRCRDIERWRPRRVTRPWSRSRAIPTTS